MYAEIEIRQLRCVIAVADELHFTRRDLQFSRRGVGKLERAVFGGPG